MNATHFLHRPTAAPSSPRAHRDGSTGSGVRAEPTWARPALVALLVFTAAAYLWDLSASGYANSFYAAAVQAGTKSWKALFFGSLDSSNFITVDKPPASLWVMALSGTHLRLQQHEHARAAGARGRGRCRAAVRGGQALVRRRRGPRGGGDARDHARRGADVPLTTTPTRCSCACSSQAPTAWFGRSRARAPAG